MKFLAIVAMSSIMINEGNTTPNVAHIEPKMPAWVEPTKVAILIATGPGVDSATAMRLRRVSLLIQA